MKIGANNATGEMEYWMIETKASQDSAGFEST
jgi:hypothetical protein